MTMMMGTGMMIMAMMTVTMTMMILMPRGRNVFRAPSKQSRVYKFQNISLHKYFNAACTNTNTRIGVTEHASAVVSQPVSQSVSQPAASQSVAYLVIRAAI